MVMENALLEVVTLCSVAADRASAAFAWQTFAGRIPHVVASSSWCAYRVVLMMMCHQATKSLIAPEQQGRLKKANLEYVLLEGPLFPFVQRCISLCVIVCERWLRPCSNQLSVLSTYNICMESCVV